MFAPPDDMPLKQARDELREQAETGGRCPCCSQWAQVYYRTINAGMAAGVVGLYRWALAHPGEFAHLPTVLGRRSAEEAKLRYWGLIEEESALRPDGGRAGYWRLTEYGASWALGRIRLPRYVRVYDGRRLSKPQATSRSGKLRPDVGIRDALGTKFDYDELMRGEGARAALTGPAA